MSGSPRFLRTPLAVALIALLVLACQPPTAPTREVVVGGMDYAFDAPIMIMDQPLRY
jgi:hypothetical protein